jgi:ABC-type multidrug transport system ATPase subunit
VLIGNVVLDIGMNGLVLDRLEKVYNNSTVAIKNLSYVYPYDHGVVGVIGPNGAGKTTLLSIFSYCQPTH